MAYRRHVKGIEKDMLPAVPEVMLTIQLRRVVCHNVEVGAYLIGVSK